MAKFSFQIKSTLDFFKKLEEDYEDYKKDMLSSRKALNCAMTGYHLCDWIFNEFRDTYPVESNRDNIIKLCPSLQIMRDLTNGTKHYSTKSNIKESKLQGGPYGRQYSRQYAISFLKIEMKDNSVLYFEDDIEIVYKFWKAYLKDKFNLQT